jgi:hypothetical protein
MTARTRNARYYPRPLKSAAARAEPVRPFPSTPAGDSSESDSPLHWSGSQRLSDHWQLVLALSPSVVNFRGQLRSFRGQLSVSNTLGRSRLVSRCSPFKFSDFHIVGNRAIRPVHLVSNPTHVTVLIALLRSQLHLSYDSCSHGLLVTSSSGELERLSLGPSPASQGFADSEVAAGRSVPVARALRVSSAGDSESLNLKFQSSCGPGGGGGHAGPLRWPGGRRRRGYRQS